MFGRRKIAMILAEFIGTFALATVVYAVLIERLPALFVATAAGLTLALVVLIVGQISGAHINPAVTLGFWTLRKIKTTTALVYIATQFFAGYIAWQFNEYFLGAHLRKIGETGFDAKILIAEAVGTFIFTFGIAAAVYQGYKGLRLAASIGASLAIGIMIASAGSNGVLNPAVALGIQSWSMSYVVGPVIGAILGMNLYAQLFAPAMGIAVAPAKAVKPATTKKPAKTITRKRK